MGRVVLLTPGIVNVVLDLNLELAGVFDFSAKLFGVNFFLNRL